MRWASGLLALLFAGACIAQTAPEGLPQVGKPVADAEFGVGTRHMGLERRVEMYQWRVSGAGYEKAWSEERIDSATFAVGHENPVDFPLPSRKWIASGIILDGKPVDAGVLAALGQWRDYRPGFSALPGNLSATFQPEGDGLGSAVNPLDPQIGDLRITWRQLMLPPLAGAVELRNGVWMLAPSRPMNTAVSMSDDAGNPHYGSAAVAAWVGAGLLALLLIFLGIHLKNRRR